MLLASLMHMLLQTKKKPKKRFDESIQIQFNLSHTEDRTSSPPYLLVRVKKMPITPILCASSFKWQHFWLVSEPGLWLTWLNIFKVFLSLQANYRRIPHTTITSFYMFSRLFLKSPDDGALNLGVLSSWILSTIQNSKRTHFRNCICFHPLQNAQESTSSDRFTRYS
jgi:hypothetical protein